MRVLLWAVLVGCAFVAGTVHAKKEKWVLRPAYSAVHFRVKHLLITTVRGSFGQVEGEVMLDTDDLTQSSVNATVYIRSLYSGDARRDRRLKGGEFFNQPIFPFATFSSKRVETDADDNLLVTGELTMHGVTREVTMEVDGPTSVVMDPNGVPSRAISAKLRLDRKDYGISWNQSLNGGGVEVGDEVIVEIDAELTPPPPPVPLAPSRPADPNAAPPKAIEPPPTKN